MEHTKKGEEEEWNEVTEQKEGWNQRFKREALTLF